MKPILSILLGSILFVACQPSTDSGDNAPAEDPTKEISDDLELIN